MKTAAPSLPQPHTLGLQANKFNLIQATPDMIKLGRAQLGRQSLQTQLDHEQNLLWKVKLHSLTPTHTHLGRAGQNETFKMFICHTHLAKT